MCTAESLHCSPETITTLLIGYTPIENKMLTYTHIQRGNKAVSPVSTVPEAVILTSVSLTSLRPQEKTHAPWHAGILDIALGLPR